MVEAEGIKVQCLHMEVSGLVATHPLRGELTGNQDPSYVKSITKAHIELEKVAELWAV